MRVKNTLNGETEEKMKEKNVFIRLAGKNLHLFLVFIILSYVLSAIVVRGANLIADAVNQMLDSEVVDIKHLIIVTTILIIVSMILAFVKKVCGDLFSIRIQKECRELAVSSIINAEYEYVRQNSGALITKLTADIGEAGELFSEIIPEVFQSAVSIITLSAAIFLMDFRLLIGILVCYPIVLFISDRISKRVNELAKKRKGRYDELTNAANDAISGIAVERSFCLYDVLNKRIDAIAEDILKNEYIRNRYQAAANAAQNLIKWLPNVCCLVIALIEVLEGNLSVGELMAFTVLFTKISSPMSELPFRINDGRELLVSVRRINDVINAPKENSGTYEFRGEYKSDDIISVNNLTYWYKSNPEKKVLNCLNLTFEKGRTTAVVGASGAGKSTLFKILCGFERPEEGVYKLFGTNFEKWKLCEARRQLAVVPQNVFLFPDTIAENVAYGNQNVKREDIEKACEEAGIHEFIMSLPDGYETVVGERGANLSGGEKQRISIARAFLKNAPVILLDEPTSALDTNTEAVISRALEQGLLKNKNTVIVIAHRLSTIKNADKIVVLDNGSVAESGTHEELMRLNGIYSGLYAKEVLHEA